MNTGYTRALSSSQVKETKKYHPDKCKVWASVSEDCAVSDAKTICSEHTIGTGLKYSETLTEQG